MTEVQFIDLSGEIKADARGMSFFPWQGRLQAPGDLLSTFHLISIRPGQSRGHHLHPGHAEYALPLPRPRRLHLGSRPRPGPGAGHLGRPHPDPHPAGPGPRGHQPRAGDPLPPGLAGGVPAPAPRTPKPSPTPGRLRANRQVKAYSRLTHGCRPQAKVSLGRAYSVCHKFFPLGGSQIPLNPPLQRGTFPAIPAVLPFLKGVQGDL